MSLATAFAILPLRLKSYEVFLVLHIALVILALAGCWYHLVPHFGYTYGYQVWLYICFAYWSYDRVFRVLRVAYHNSLGKSMAIVELILGCDIMQVTVFPRVAWRFGPGQHSFLFVPGLGKFLESHPFSVAGWTTRAKTASITSPHASFSASGEKIGSKVIDSSVLDLESQTNSTTQRQYNETADQLQDRVSIRFLMRIHSGMTSTLHRKVLSSPSPTRMEMSVYTECSYGGHRAALQPLHDANTVLCLAGGIGITNALGFIQEYTAANIQTGGGPAKGRGIMSKTKRFILAWSAKELHLIEHVKQNFILNAGNVSGLEYSFWCTGDKTDVASSLMAEPFNDDSQKAESRTRGMIPYVMRGKMNLRGVIGSSVERGYETTVIVCCPGRMADKATREIFSCLKDGFRVDLIEEFFAW
ncbi:hypothetical protein MMC25_000613 [Agyrium rufum]|nr:hypothetical protein [Agyrium rufum]